MSAAPTTLWRPRANPWIVAISVMLATFMEVLDTSVANVALPHIAGSLAASTDEATWVLTSYLVSNAIILPAAAWLGGMVGRKRLLMGCIVLFTFASVACGAAFSLGMIVVARVLQGLGGGALQPIAQAVLLESFPPDRRGGAMAVYGMGVVVAPIVGPTLGGWITDNYSWRWIFYINVPVGVLAVIMTQMFVEDPPYIRRVRGRRLDYIGFGLMALWLSTLQVVLDKGQEADWFASMLIRVLTVGSILAMIGFIARELTASDPIVDLRIMSERNFAVGVALITAMGIVLYSSTALMPLFLQTLLGYPALQSGEAMTPRGIGALISMLVVGRLVRMVDTRVLITMGFAGVATATYLLGGLNLEIAMRNVAWPNVLAGLAMGFIFVPLTTTTMGTLSNEQMGNATGLYNLMRNIGGSIGIAGATTMLARGAQSHQAILAQHLTPYDPEFQTRLDAITGALTAALGRLEAQRGALEQMQALVTRQATLLAFVDEFRWLSVLCLLCIPLVWLFKRVKARADVVAH